MKFRRSALYFVAILIVFGVSFVDKTYAVSPESVLVNIAPENPAPNENTTITLNSYASNLDSVSITWSVNGKRALSGIGNKSFSLNAPTAGSSSTVTVTISLPDGDVEKKIVIRPAEMVLLWQADDSYVPPFYKGKAMPTPSSEVKVVAMPEVKSGSKMVSPSNMVYAWKKDYSNVQDASGYGKNYFIYTNDYLDGSNNIGVTASTIDQSQSSEISIDIGTTDPKILFYKNDPILGTLWENIISNGYKINSDEVIAAIPFFISPADFRSPILAWKWFINGDMVSVSTLQPDLLPLKLQPGVSGISKIKAQVDNNYKIFETASREISVQF